MSDYNDHLGFGFLYRQPTEEELVQYKKDNELALAQAKLRASLLPKFDPNKMYPCTKCGCTIDRKIRFCKYNVINTTGCGDQTADREHLHLTCRTCKHVDYYLPLDAE